MGHNITYASKGFWTIKWQVHWLKKISVQHAVFQFSVGWNIKYKHHLEMIVMINQARKKQFIKLYSLAIKITDSTFNKASDLREIQFTWV